jgi:hypothetical protein
VANERCHRKLDDATPRIPHLGQSTIEPSKEGRPKRWAGSTAEFEHFDVDRTEADYHDRRGETARLGERAGMMLLRMKVKVRLDGLVVACES